MDVVGGMIYVYLFFVGIDCVCILDERIGLLCLLVYFLVGLFSGIFLVVYVGVFDNYVLFLINGCEFLGSMMGYIYLFEINKSMLQIKL